MEVFSLMIIISPLFFMQISFIICFVITVLLIYCLLIVIFSFLIRKSGMFIISLIVILASGCIYRLAGNFTMSL